MQWCVECFEYLPPREPGRPGRPRKYCSKRCQNAAHRRIAREREPHTVTPMRPCTCNRDFLTVPLEEAQRGWCCGH